MRYSVTNSYRDANMTSLLDYINTTYAQLYKIFGKPIDASRCGSGDGKTNSSWIIKFAGR